MNNNDRQRTQANGRGGSIPSSARTPAGRAPTTSAAPRTPTGGNGTAVRGNTRSPSAGRSAGPDRTPPRRPSVDTALPPGGSRPSERVRFDDFRIVRDKKNIDFVMLVIILLLVGIGIVAIVSASYPEAYVTYKGDGFYIIRNHLIFVVLGFLGMTAMCFVDPSILKTVAVPAFLLAEILLFAVFTPLGKTVNGARRWLDVGFRLQPSELMKLTLPMLLAWYYDPKKPKPFSKLVLTPAAFDTYTYGLFVPAGILAVAMLPEVLQPHFSCVIILGVIGLSVMILAHPTLKLGWFIPVGAVGVAGYLLTHPYAQQRLTSDAEQSQHGVEAIGAGGLFGVGWGGSRMKYSFIPEAQNDFVFSIWCEEMGFIGAMIVVVLFLVFVIRGYEIARRAPDTFSRLLVYGIVTKVGVQAFLNMLVVTDVAPTTGVSLPFISYGGTALIVTLGEMGIVLSVSRHTYHKELLTSSPRPERRRVRQ